MIEVKLISEISHYLYKDFYFIINFSYPSVKRARFFLILFQLCLSDTGQHFCHNLTMGRIGHGQVVPITVPITPEPPETTSRQGNDNDDKTIDLNNPTILALIIVAAIVFLIVLVVVAYLCYQVKQLTNFLTN